MRRRSYSVGKFLKMKSTKYILILLLVINSFSNETYAQTQLGQDFILTEILGRAGRAMSMNEAGSRIAIGQPRLFPLDQTGYVEVFEFNGSSWERLGSRIESIATGEQFGTSISMNADGTRFVVGALKSNVNGTNSGYAKIYEYQDTGGGNFDWIEIGYFQGDSGDEFGASVSMNAAGDFIAIGSPYDDTPFTDCGSVKMFEYVNGNWEAYSNAFGQTTNVTAFGPVIEGLVANEQIGTSVRINSNNRVLTKGNTVVRVYDASFVTGNWLKKGSDISISGYTQLIGDFGINFSAYIHEHENTLGISSSNNRIVIGDPYANVGSNSYAGEVRVYELVSDNWQQIGQDIQGTEANLRLGHAVNISSDGNRIGIGSLALDNFDNQVRKVYDYLGSSWVQSGTNIDNDTSPLRQNVVLNPDGDIFAFANTNSGVIGIYRVSEPPTISTVSSSSITPFQATVEGDIDSDGRENITERGFVFSSTVTNPEIGNADVDQVIDSSTDLGNFSKILSGLISGTTYYYRAYATNLNGTAYGDVLTFTTLAVPSIVTNTPTNEGSFATLGGTITDMGEVTIVERGVIYSTNNSLLEIGESGVQQQVIVSDDMSFSQTITNLSFDTQYYTRAYVFIDVDGELYDIYGNIENFTTLSTDTAITFLGSLDNNWSNPPNWDLNRLPNSSDNVIINSVAVINSSEEATAANIQANRYFRIDGKLTTNTLTAAGSARIDLYGDLTVNVAINLEAFNTNDIIIQDGGSFILNGSYSGEGLLNYYRTVTPNHWLLMCSPFADNSIYEFLVFYNSVLSSGTNHAYAPYNNSYTGITDVWDYIQSSEIPTGPPPNYNPPHILDQVKGYGSSVSATNMRFIGTPEEEDISIAVTMGSADSYNLVGNPYPSYLDANALLNANSSVLEEKTLWTWDENTETYKAYNLINSYEIPPTTGFFVESTVSGGTFNVTESMQMHETNSISTHPQIELSVTDGTDSKITNIYYSDNGTTGLDNGYDSSLFEGYRPDFSENLSTESLNLYTALVSDQMSEKLMVQTLPNENHETMIVPIGVEAVSGTTLTFNATSFNFTTPVFIEDREEGIFHPLNFNNSYEVTLTSDLNGSGRFYLRLDQVYPILTTTVESVDDSFATLGGIIEETGNSTITETGVVYATENTNLQIGQSGVIQQSINSSESIFSQQVFGLSFETTYYVRSYIITDEFDIVYGPEETFTTLPEDTSTITFLGTVDSDWSDPANWDLNRLPNSSDNVIINSIAVINSSEEVTVANIQANRYFRIDGRLTTNTLTVSGSTGIDLYGDLTVNFAINLQTFVTNDLIIRNGGSFILNGSYLGEGLLNYYRTVTSNHWLLMCSPFADNTIYEFLVLQNSVLSSGTNQAYAPYNNSYTGLTDVWDYIQSSEIPTSFPPNGNPPHILDQVKGYGSSVSATNMRFIGTPEEEDISIAVTMGSADSYNLVGNPYPSYLDANALLNANSSVLEEKTLWTWDENTETYKAYNLINSYEIPPTTGFFVESTVSGGTFNVTESMQMHETNSISTHPQIELSVTDGTDSKITNIYYSDNGTTGLDNGYDSSLFEGYRPDFPENLSTESFNLYTALVSDQMSEKLMVQTLPNENHETMIVPIGVEASSGTTLTFNATSFNFTTPVYLEDREEGVFYLLTETSFYEVTLSEELTGLGRFYLRTGFSKGELTNTWLGASSEWNSISNWDLSFVPIDSVNVVIPQSPQNGMVFPTVNGDVSVNRLELDSGARLTVVGTIRNNDTIVVNSGASIIADSATGLLTYKRYLPEDNWFLVAPPVEGLTIQDFIASNNLATGNGNVGLQEFSSDYGWSIYQSNSTGSMNNGQGYAVRLPEAGEVQFTGTLRNEDSQVAIEEINYRSNLIGNPFPSYIPVNVNANESSNILAQNSDELSELTIWFWDQYIYAYRAVNNASDPVFISPGQGFFVHSNSGSRTFTINKGIQSHQSDVFYRSSNFQQRPKIIISINDNEFTKQTELYYREGLTLGFDNGYDSSHFGFASDDLAIFTRLPENDNETNYSIQTLPLENIDGIEVAIGINAVSNTEIDFAFDVQSFPEDIKVYLEDREEGVFIDMNEDNASYTLLLESGSSDVGRFYLHTTSEVLSSDYIIKTSDTINIYMENKTMMRISGLPNNETELFIFDTQGKEVFMKKFISQDVDQIQIPNISSGIYFVRLKNQGVIFNRKIVIN